MRSITHRKPSLSEAGMLRERLSSAARRAATHLLRALRMATASAWTFQPSPPARPGRCPLGPTEHLLCQAGTASFRTPLSRPAASSRTVTATQRAPNRRTPVARCSSTSQGGIPRSESLYSRSAQASRRVHCEVSIPSHRLFTAMQLMSMPW